VRLVGVKGIINRDNAIPKIVIRKAATSSVIRSLFTFASPFIF